MTLPPGWQRCTLDDVKAPVDHAIAGGPFGSDLTAADYAESGVPVIRGCNLGHGERRFYPDDIGHFLTIHAPERLAVFFPSLVFGFLRSRTKGIGAGLASGGRSSARSASSPPTCRGRASCCRRAR